MKMNFSRMFKVLGLTWALGFLSVSATTNTEVLTDDVTGNNDDSVLIGKCCGRDMILVDDICTPLSQENEMNETTVWQPEFDVDRTDGKSSKKSVKYSLQFGRPICRSDEHESHVYHYPNGGDLLVILSTGKLRHFIPDLTRSTGERIDNLGRDSYDDDDDNIESVETVHYDYPFGHYCIEKAVLTGERLVATYAMVCVPVLTTSWTDTSYFMKHVVDPTFRAISMCSYLAIAIVYFVLPQLRDLVGNMITSMSLCLVASQSASTVRTFTEYGNHVSFIAADTVTYVSLLAAFFWLNVIGYYVWITFRSRNVFLRVTDGRKYCYYSSYVWGATLSVSATAIFAHFALETNKSFVTGTSYPPQETIGWLGLSVIFTTVAFTIIIDLCFVLTTSSTIKRMSTYGRIHHKMKYSFRMFALMFAIMSFGWLSLLLSQLKYEVLVYCHIVINFLQAILMLYVCVFGQKRVTFLLGKTCNCCTSNESPPEGLDWGEEMTAINAGY